MSCLQTPNNGGTCIPSYPANGPTFLDSQLSSLLSKSGYSRSFATGGVAAPLNSNISGTASTSAYAYFGTPVNVGQTGVRGFAGDHSGVLCFTTAGTYPPNGSGALQTSCNVLQ